MERRRPANEPQTAEVPGRPDLYDGERARSEEAKSRQALVFENMSDAVVITDLDGRITDWNTAAKRIFGYDREEMLGHTVRRLYELDDPRELETEVIADMVRADRWSGTLRFRRKDGSTGICETVVVPLRNAAGERIATIGVNRDVTERAQFEAELAKSHALLEAVTEGTDDAIFAKDLDGRYVMMNGFGVHLFGKPPEDIIGRDDTELFPPEEAEKIRELDRQVMDTGVTSTFEEVVTLLGIQNRFLTSKAPWRDAAGNVIGVIGIARDVTERWRAEELAKQRQTELAHVLRLKTMGEMAAGLAHELNQPLAAVANYARGCTRRLKDGTANPDDLLPIMEEVSAQAIRAGNIVRRLHSLVRRQPSKQEQFDVNELIRGTVQLVEADLRHASIVLQLKLGPPLYTDGDPIQIEQVVLNLVKNAIDAMSSSGVLLIESARTPDNAVQISVSDTGPGLDERQLQSIFDPFVTTKPDGLGMGLAISRSIAESHRGRLSASNSENGGAIFRLVLPATVATR